jgi:hypothetical protein
MAFVHSDSLALPAVLLEPEKASGAVLMVGGGGRADFAAEALSALSAGKRVLIVDITGCGEIGKSRHVFYSAKDTPEEGAALMLYMLGESMVGRRATDVLAAADWLGRRSGGKVELFAKGSAAIGAAHAYAVGRGLFSGVKVENAPVSWSEVLTKEGMPVDYRFAHCVNGALLYYDWTDLLGL